MTALPPRPASGGSRAARLLASASRPPDADRAALCATLPAIHSIFALFRGQGSHPSPPPSLRVLPLPTGAEAVGRRGDGEGPGDGCIHAPRARCAASAPSGRPVEDVPSLPQAVPAPPLLLCSGLRTAPCLYTIARSSTARFRLVTALRRGQHYMQRGWRVTPRPPNPATVTRGAPRSRPVADRASSAARNRPGPTTTVWAALGTSRVASHTVTAPLRPRC